MKFWKSLSNLIEETLPEWRDKFLSYKDLKKQMKLIYPKPVEGDRPSKRSRLADDSSAADVAGSCNSLSASDGGEGHVEEVEAKKVTDFVKLLEEEIEKFNAFFVDQEEEYIIRLKVLQDCVAEAMESNENLMRVGREIVDFHGEMVLLENYSALNYTGLVKILKKYDKRSGALIRLPFIQKVLKEPFFSTDILNKLVKETERMLDHLFSLNEQRLPSQENETINDSIISEETGKQPLKVPDELAEIKNMESMYMKLTTSALRVLKEIRSGSSTVNMFSLPPLQSGELEEVWKKTPALEQEAK